MTEISLRPFDELERRSKYFLFHCGIESGKEYSISRTLNVLVVDSLSLRF